MLPRTEDAYLEAVHEAGGEVAELSEEIDVERAERALERAQAESDALAEQRADARLRTVAATR